MLKVADLHVTTKETDERFLINFTPGYKDKLITSICFTGLTWFAATSFTEYPFLGFIVWLLVIWYCYDILEDHVTVSLDKKEDKVHVKRSKLGKTMQEINVPAHELVGTVMAEKDLHMGDARAHRLELRFASGFCVPLSKAYIVNKRLLESLIQVRKKVDSFIHRDDPDYEQEYDDEINTKE